MGVPGRALADLLRAQSIEARCRSVVGLGANGSVGSTPLYFDGTPDVQVTLNSWSMLVFLAIGGNLYSKASGTTGEALTFAFDGVDTAAIGFPMNNYGVLRYRTDGGAWTTLDENTGGVQDLLRVEIALGSVGAHTVEIERVSGTVYVSYCESWASTDNVVVVPWGARAYTSANLNDTTRPWSYKSALAEVPFDIGVLNVGINDVNTGVAQATYETNLGAYLDAMIAQVGVDDTFVCIPNDISGGLSYLPTSIATVAAAKSLPSGNVIDLRTGANMSTYATANGAGLMYDTLHPNNLGYANMYAVVEPILRPRILALA